MTSGGATATSATNTQTYLDVVAPASPTFNTPPGTYTGAIFMYIGDATPGALVYYSLNGGPWTLFTGAPLGLPAQGNSTLKAVAYLSDGPNYAVSPVVGGLYVIQYFCVEDAGNVRGRRSSAPFGYPWSLDEYWCRTTTKAFASVFARYGFAFL